jgi:hypothetical protein
MATRLEDDGSDEVFLLEKTVRQASPYIAGNNNNSKPGSRRGSASAGSRPMVISPGIGDTELHKRVETLEDKMGRQLVQSKLTEEMVVELSNNLTSMNKILADYTGERVNLGGGGDVSTNKSKCCGCCCTVHNGGCNLF